MGNIFVRAESGKLVYGFSVKTAAGTWKDYKEHVNLPEVNQRHVIQMKYEAAESAKLTVWIDGVQGPSAISAAGEKAAISNGKDKIFGIGSEVNPDPAAAARGWAGNFSRARIADADASWKFRSQNQLLHIDFRGTLRGVNYIAAAAEDNTGTLSARTPAPAVENSFAVFTGRTSGFDFTAPDFSLGTGKVTTGFAAEMKFTPAETGVLQTLFAAGGNIFLRYNAAGQLEFGISYQENGKWADQKITAAAPAGAQHTVSVAYVPNSAGTAAVLQMRVDGTDQAPVTASSLAALENPIAAKVSFANEVHPAALDRGFTGKIDEIRFARTDAKFTPDDFKLTYVSDICDTSGVLPANTIEVTSNECADLIKAKLSALRPTEKQADYLDWGQIGFVHFNVNTFTGNSWGHGTEDPAVINAETIDTDQWARTFADAGFKMIMVTVKHHDGFELFDSRYNRKHDWPSTATAKNGGPKDLFAQIVKSARKHGLKVGVYYSPADSYMQLQNVFANGSPKSERTIPTLTADDDRAARVASGELPTFKYQATDYGEYMLNQLYELLTDYGAIDEVWFDGAQGNTTKPEYYDYAAFYDLIGKLQPQAIQANAAPDARWIGNESGWARTSEWSPQGVSFDQYGKIMIYPRQTAADGVLGSIESVIDGVRTGAITKLHWYPGEVDAKNGPEWFNNSGKRGPNKPKSMSEIVTFYEQSTGRNAQFLLNMPPHTDGRLPQDDADIMRAYREELLRRYGTDLALGKESSVAASAAAAAVPAPKLTDGSKLSADPAAGNTPIYTVKFGAPTKVDAVILGEDVRSSGQQVERFKVQGRDSAGMWRDLTAGTTIGQQRNLRFAESLVSEIRLEVTSSRGPVQMARIEVYHSESEIQDGPRAYFIDPSAVKAGDGKTADTPMNSIEALHDISLVPGSVILVKNGTALTGDFAVFGYGTADQPITVTTYGDGAAPAVALNGIKATTLEALLTELAKDQAGWKFAAAIEQLPALRNYIPQEDLQPAASSQNADAVAESAFDGKSDTIWHNQWEPSAAAGPHSLTIDLGKRYEDISYVDYLGRVTANRNGTAKNYRIYTGDSAENLTLAQEGVLEDKPYTHRIALGAPAAGRFVKFEIVSSYGDNVSGSAAEINVETAAIIPEVPGASVHPEEKTYTVTVKSANPNQGTAAISAAGPFKSGDKVKLTAAPNAGFEFVNWVNADGKEVSKDAVLVVTVGEANAAYTANFQAGSHKPAEPVDPVAPVEPADPVDPVEPKPGDPVQPADPSSPSQPNQPGGTGETDAESGKEPVSDFGSDSDTNSGEILAKTGAGIAGALGIAALFGVMGISLITRRRNRETSL
ncbi:alpha-L-fucosidase [Arcanobacterium hippocoleae]